MNEQEKPQPKTEEELKQLALDISEGKVFTDRHLSDVRDLSAVLMPLAFLDEAGIEKLKADDPGMVYEYMDKAGPMAVNDMPCFFSMRLLSRDEAKKVGEYYRELKASKDPISAEAQPA